MATREQLIEDFADHKYATGEKFARLINSMKVVQEPVADPAASGTSLSFIDSIEQDADGKISATKKTLDLSNAHELNPFKGWWKTGDTLPTSGFDGAYLYFKDTTQTPAVTTIYQWNGTAYANTGTVVDESNVQTFASGQAVNTVHIKNEKGEEVTGPAGVLSAEAGAKLSQNVAVINMDKEYPLDSGYYQCTDASAANFAPTNVPADRRKDGLIITFCEADKSPVAYQFAGGQFAYAPRWKRIMSFGDGIADVTALYPLSNGYYQCTDADAANFAPKAIPSYLRKTGMVLSIQTAALERKMYVFQSPATSTASWERADRWSEMITKPFEIWETIEHGSPSSTSLVVSSAVGIKSGATTLNIKLSGVGFYAAKPLTISVNGVSYSIVDEAGNSLTCQSMVRLDKWYQFVYNGSQFVLNNSDDFAELFPVVEEDYNFRQHGVLESGYISISNGMDGSLASRVRTRCDVLYKSPLKVVCKSGYKVTGYFAYDANGFVSAASNTNVADSIEIPSDNYYYRFVFRKSDGSNFASADVDLADIVAETAGVSEVVDLTNVENMVAVGTSHTEGNGSLKGKSFLSYLSALYDWVVVNLGDSGQSYIEAIYQYLNDTTLGCGAKFSDINKKGICLDFLGGGAENVYMLQNAKYTIMNMKRFYSIMRSMGYEVIVGTYFGDHVESMGEIQNKVAKELGLQFVQINSECTRGLMNEKNAGGNLGAFGFKYFLWNNHFATRTVADQFYPFWKAAKIRRPRTSIKVFRSRGLESSNDDLLYNNVFERIKWWREIEVNHRALGNDAYVDRLEEQPSKTTIASEYTALRRGSTLTVAKKALVEFVLPAVAGGLNNLKLHVGCAGSGTQTCYLRKYVDNSLAIALTTGYIRFVLDDVTGINVNGTFTCNINDAGYDWSGITFTVKSVDADTNVVMAEPSSSINSTPGATSAVITYGGANINATNITTGVPNAYTDAYALGGIGKWESVTMDGYGFVTIANPEKYMDFDKVSLMIVGDGVNSFTIGDIYAMLNVEAEKPQSFYEPRSNDFLCGQWKNVLSDKFSGTTSPTSSAGGAVVVSNSGTHGYGWDGKITGFDGNQIPYYHGIRSIDTILHLNAGNTITYTIPEMVHVWGDAVKHLRLKIIARYFPAFNSNVNAETFTITQDTFDFAKIGIRTNVSNSAAYLYTNEVYVPASWVEVEQDIYLDQNSANSLVIEALDDNVEILKVEMWEEKPEEA